MEADLTKKIKSNVREIMEAKGFTLRKLEDKTGLNHVTILNARSDEKIQSCRLNTLQIIAAALGVSVKDLFDEK